MSNSFDNLKAGLERAIAHAHGEIRLDTKEVQLPGKPKAMSAKQIAILRRDKLHLSQNAFARILNAAPQTVQAWEHGRSKPSGCALRFLELLDHNPSILDELLHSAG